LRLIAIGGQLSRPRRFMLWDEASGRRRWGVEPTRSIDYAFNLIARAVRPKPKENEKSKYDGSHDDDVDDAHTFSFVDHSILARTKLSSISPVSNPLEKAAKSATVRGWRCGASPPRQPLGGNTWVAEYLFHALARIIVTTERDQSMSLDEAQSVSNFMKARGRGGGISEPNRVTWAKNPDARRIARSKLCSSAW
jgi:hypothetical protein